ncbi:hypothetical protein [Schinkia azotoformans]|uniref:hypothetical protein n=1 Tax=Schinkia azotoformans TaxID=1454 RepID=UPI002DB993C0|nr:hypothetical protein [Schinkia azotoformans]MEC1718454.1 hypothetical protein [Schinkia azotoformans]MEC1759828.1 hypothetical protein [Schinkia azotoformans]
MKIPLLLQIDAMNATDTIVEALQIRGFLVEKENDFIALQEGSGKADAWGLRRLLKRLNIPTFWQGDRVQILVNHLPFSIAQKIVHTPGRNHPFEIKDYQKKWRHFANRRYGLKTNTLDLDPNIALLVKALNKAGITAITGCDGHMKHAPVIRLSGPFTGAWLKIVQEKYLGHLNLHYKWDVKNDDLTGTILIVQKARNKIWSSSYILKDTTTMAYTLMENASTIRNIKSASFKRNEEMKKIATNYAEELKYDELQAWMESLVKRA